MKILVPPGIGDSVWALMKVRSLVRHYQDPEAHIRIACWSPEGHETRALEFMSRFDVVTSAEMYVMPRDGNAGPCCLPGPQADSNGINNYISDEHHPDLPGIDVVMIPNRHLEEGKRLEDWLPEYEIDWEIMDRFRFLDREVADAATVRSNLGPFAVFFMASLAGNTFAGHNRGPIWTPEQWVDLGERLHREWGLQIVVVGADWDRDYYESQIVPIIGRSTHWHDRIGAWPIGMTYSIVKKSQMVVAYQSGVGIVAHYLRIPTAMWWRSKGDSISPTCYVSHDEAMASGWARPDAVSTGALFPCIYGRETVDQIVDHARSHGW